MSESELEIMKIIWANDRKALFSEIMAVLEEREINWKKNTVLTFLSRITEKGLLKVKKVGRKNEYIAQISEEDFMAQKTEDFISEVYEGNVTGLISTLLQKDMITKKEIELLKDFWNKES